MDEAFGQANKEIGLMSVNELRELNIDLYKNIGSTRIRYLNFQGRVGRQRGIAMDHLSQRHKCETGENCTGRLDKPGGVGVWGQGVDRKQSCAKFVRGANFPGKDRLFSWQPISIFCPLRTIAQTFNKSKLMLKISALARSVDLPKSRNLTVPKIGERFGMSTWRIHGAGLD